MAGLRSLIATHRHALAVLLGLALLVRLLVPAGWMAEPSAGAGLVLVPCTGMAPATAPAEAHGPVHGAPAHDGHAHGEQPDHGDTTGNHPCAFAGAAQTVAPPLVFALPLPPVPARVVDAPRLFVAVGRGLAAPPPPPTGPPTFA